MKRIRQIMVLSALLSSGTTFAQSEDVITIVSPSKKIETMYVSRPKLVNGTDVYQFTDKNTTVSFAKKERIVIRLKPEAIVGDIDGDRTVTLADVYKLAGIILGSEKDSFGNADVDKNGKIEIADITKLIKLLK